MREVAPLIGDARGQPGDAEPGFALPLAVPSLSGNGPLGAAQGLGGDLRELRRGDCLPRGQSHQRSETKVDTNLGKFPLARLRLRHLDLEADKPFAGLNINYVFFIKKPTLGSLFTAIMSFFVRMFEMVNSSGAIRTS